MNWAQYFRKKNKNETASRAKERLQIIVSERRSGGEISYIPELKRDILEVLKKYVQVDDDMVDVTLDQMDKDTSVLELNVRLPDDV